MEELLREILGELKGIRNILEDQEKRGLEYMEQHKKTQEAEKEKIRSLLKTVSPQFADMI